MFTIVDDATSNRFEVFGNERPIHNLHATVADLILPLACACVVRFDSASLTLQIRLKEYCYTQRNFLSSLFI